MSLDGLVVVDGILIHQASALVSDDGAGGLTHNAETVVDRVASPRLALTTETGGEMIVA